MIEDDHPQHFVRLMTPDEVETHVKGLPLAVALERFDWLEFWPVVDEDDVVVDVVDGKSDKGILYPRCEYTYDERRDVYVDPDE